MDALKYQVRLAQEEAQKYRTQHNDLLKQYISVVEENEHFKLQNQQLEETIKKLEKKIRFTGGNSLDIDGVISIPFIFESIVKKMKITSQFRMMRTNHRINDQLTNMMKKKSGPLNPFSDVSILIEQAMWQFGFTSVHFECFLTSAAEKNRLDTVGFKIRGRDQRVFMSKTKFQQSILGLKPKEFVFNFGHKRDDVIVINNTFFPQHINFLIDVQPQHGTPTTIQHGEDYTIRNILEIMQPKTLVLLRPRVDHFPNLFREDGFQTVENLRITGFDERDQLIPDGFSIEQLLDTTPIEHQLVSLEVEGVLSSFPCQHVNSLIKAWVGGRSNLREINFVIDENEIQPVIHDVLRNLQATTVKFHIIPGQIRDLIMKDFAGYSTEPEAFSYRLLASPPKKQMACVYYCHSVKAPFADRANSHFGFVAVDLYPERK